MGAWRRTLATILATLGLCLAFGAGAVDMKEGRDFRRINPPLAVESGKIEITEFFWYGCSHCFDFEPVLAAWVKKQPADISFRRVPAIFPNNKWLPGAGLYYTLEAMNRLEKMHIEVFSAIHVDRERLDDGKDMLEWAKKKGVDAKQFSDTWLSFGVQSRVFQAHRLTQAAGITGVPGVMVQGRYLIPTTGKYDEMLGVADQLIARVRAEAARK